MAEQPLTDREQLLHWQQEQKAEAQAVDHALHYSSLGVGLAVFCQTMFATLLQEPEPGALPMFTRDEALRLVLAAVAGR